ncbi:unnamed protein product [Didymodactylos carnosus]|uniref:Uncharacterized protein n=1 Tax=Didymodactylos carnosus TaxID=1234261 RepID=A0A814Y6J8_9BILA|nr:unnamed protein product [Didymodactylos carnosus]CAF0810564.1 unnamed protein product [Didymodactylos carnosus]CAF1225066.1 unnamed protein product [Didymodactylos carnosus]CAF3594745.1 unnamed protein product [Didymodactylos carnosus]CAF3594802.1 unnamed protein product [Didymodactylos carnosus]
MSKPKSTSRKSSVNATLLQDLSSPLSLSVVRALSGVSSTQKKTTFQLPVITSTSLLTTYVCDTQAFLSSELELSSSTPTMHHSALSDENQHWNGRTRDYQIPEQSNISTCHRCTLPLNRYTTSIMRYMSILLWVYQTGSSEIQFQ